MSHPIDDLAERYGAGLVAFGLVVTVVAVGQLASGSVPAAVAAIAVAAWITADVTIDDDVLSGEPPSELDVERERYVEGDIDHAEFERRAELILDDRAQRIRETVETIKGIGPSTSAAIASEFDDLAELRVASVDELTAIHDVGESTATAVIDEVGVDAEDVRALGVETATDVEAAEVSSS